MHPRGSHCQAAAVHKIQHLTLPASPFVDVYNLLALAQRPSLALAQRPSLALVQHPSSGTCTAAVFLASAPRPSLWHLYSTRPCGTCTEPVCACLSAQLSRAVPEIGVAGFGLSTLGFGRQGFGLGLGSGAPSLGFRNGVFVCQMARVASCVEPEII